MLLCDVLVKLSTSFSYGCVDYIKRYGLKKIMRSRGGEGVMFFLIKCFLFDVGLEPKIRPFANAKHPDSASQRPECNGPAPHCPARLFDHEARPAR